MITFSSTLKSFCFCCLFILPVLSSAQQTTLQEIQTFIQQTTPENIAPQVLEADSYFVRFNELGALYNPTFPATRNKVNVQNFKVEGTGLLFIGKSLSTFRASVILKGRVGEFYCVMGRDGRNAIIKYQVAVSEADGKLKVTGQLYKGF